MIDKKLILDACCGGRMFWFDKKHPAALYIDSRKIDTVKVGKGKNARNYSCDPDQQQDFRNLNFANDTFRLVVFDPPHLHSLGSKSFMAIKYGKLNKETWKEDLSKGFAECFRVLKLTTHKPLFGHPSGKMQKTHWVCFMKLKN
jgi:hypothetical protein